MGGTGAKMKAFVTGGGGFLGKAIVKQLLARGDEVISYSRGQYPELIELGATHVQGDLDDLDKIIKAMNGCDAVFHVAAKAGIWGSYKEFYRANVTGTGNIITACQKLKIKKLLFTSTPSVVHDGNGSEGKNESLPYPKKFYANYPKTKAMAEKMTLDANSSELSTAALRPHLIWGPDDHHFYPRLTSKGRAGKLRILGDNPNKVDCIYIENAAKAHVQAMDKLEPNSTVAGKAYFISQDQPIPIAELINRILKTSQIGPVKKKLSPKIAYAAGAVFELVYGALRIKSEPPMTRFLAKQLSTPHWYNISAAKKDFGYRPEISLDEGMQNLESWVKRQKHD